MRRRWPLGRRVQPGPDPGAPGSGATHGRADGGPWFGASAGDTRRMRHRPLDTWITVDRVGSKTPGGCSFGRRPRGPTEPQRLGNNACHTVRGPGGAWRMPRPRLWQGGPRRCHGDPAGSAVQEWSLTPGWQGRASDAASACRAGGPRRRLIPGSACAARPGSRGRRGRSESCGCRRANVLRGSPDPIRRKSRGRRPGARW